MCAVFEQWRLFMNGSWVFEQWKMCMERLRRSSGSNTRAVFMNGATPNIEPTRLG